MKALSVIEKSQVSAYQIDVENINEEVLRKTKRHFQNLDTLIQRIIANYNWVWWNRILNEKQFDGWYHDRSYGHFMFIAISYIVEVQNIKEQRYNIWKFKTTRNNYAELEKEFKNDFKDWSWIDKTFQ